MNRQRIFQALLVLLWFAGAVTGVLGNDKVPDSTSTGDASNQIAGEWKGENFHYPEMVIVTLNLRLLSMDRIEGECALVPALIPKFRNVGRAVRSSWIRH